MKRGVLKNKINFTFYKSERKFEKWSLPYEWDEGSLSLVKEIYTLLEISYHCFPINVEKQTMKRVSHQH